MEDRFGESEQEFVAREGACVIDYFLVLVLYLWTSTLSFTVLFPQESTPILHTISVSFKLLPPFCIRFPGLSCSIPAVQGLWTHYRVLIWRIHIGKRRNSRPPSVLSRSPGYMVQECLVDVEHSRPLHRAHCQRWPLRTAAAGESPKVSNIPCWHSGVPSSRSQYFSTRGNSPHWGETVCFSVPPVVGLHDATSLDRYIGQASALLPQALTWVSSGSHPHSPWNLRPGSHWGREAMKCLWEPVEGELGIRKCLEGTSS